MADIEELRKATLLLTDLSNERFSGYSKSDMIRMSPDRMMGLILLNQQALLMGLIDELVELNQNIKNLTRATFAR